MGYLVVAFEETGSLQTISVAPFGELPDVRYYMEFERVCFLAKRLNELFQRDIELPGAYVATEKGPWQHMQARDFLASVRFTRRQYRLHHYVGRQMKLIADAPLRYCVLGCLQNCVQEHSPARSTLIEQYYIMVGDRTHVVRVSHRPTASTGEGVKDVNGHFVIPEVQFLQRRNSLVVSLKWALTRRLLKRCRMPHMMAGEKPVIVQRQENLRGLQLADQQCTSTRPPIFNDEWPGLDNIRSTVIRVSSSSSSSATSLSPAPSEGTYDGLMPAGSY